MGIARKKRSETLFAWLGENTALTFLISVIFALIIGYIGDLFVHSSLTSRFAMLIKPVFLVGYDIFKTFWIFYYLFMGIALYFILRDGIQKKERITLTLFGIQLFLCLFWAFCFFELKWIGGSTFIGLLLLLFLGRMTYEYGKINKTGAYIMMPCLVRVLYLWICNNALRYLN